MRKSLFILLGLIASVDPDNARKRFYMQSQSLTWSAARSSCMSCFEDLAVIKSSLKTQSIPATGLTLWVGASRPSGGSFTWVDGSLLTYTNWCPGEPNFANENCVSVYPDRTWNNYLCTNLLPFLCQEDAYSGVLTFSDVTCSSLTLNWTQAPGPVVSYTVTARG
ncbi:C-type mannose receptor 2-like, partial [Polypterus senegalus]|uniref:C-type mannose receptor 2-like n=1 Tax=Polypterus senegalus TaxID=55291 RepID=UPI00196317F8